MCQVVQSLLKPPAGAGVLFVAFSLKNDYNTFNEAIKLYLKEG